MKNLLYKLHYLSIILALASFGCSQDYELKESIFRSDSEFPGLPEYSEWGYNTFGANYDRNIFISNSEDVPMKVIVNSGTTTFLFQGQKGSNYYNNNTMQVSITVNNLTFANYGELVALDKISYDLTSPDISISISEDGAQLPVSKLNGHITFNRCQNLLVDKTQTETILSGTFDWQVLVNGTPITLGDGRFDVGIGRYNFFVII